MPCRDEGEPIYVDNPELKKKLDKVTRLLCSTMKELEAQGMWWTIKSIESGELKEWWEKHKKADAKREAKEVAKLEEKKRKEKLRKEALSKLTAEEKKALKLRSK